jgi:hypothetical protein
MVYQNPQYEFSPSWYSSVTEEYQDDKNSYCEFFGLVPFLQKAIHIDLAVGSEWELEAGLDKQRSGVLSNRQ